MCFGIVQSVVPPGDAVNYFSILTKEDESQAKIKYFSIIKSID